MSGKLREIVEVKSPKLNDPRWQPFTGQGKVKRHPAGWSALVFIADEPTPCHIIPNVYKDWSAVKIRGVVGFARITN